MLFAFVVLDLVSPVLCQDIGWEERLRNDLFLCRIKRKTLTQSIRNGYVWGPALV